MSKKPLWDLIVDSIWDHTWICILLILIVDRRVKRGTTNYIYIYIHNLGIWGPISDSI